MTTEERVERLERELASAKRRIRWLMAGAGLLLVVFGFGMVARGMTGVAHGQEKSDKKVIRANEFVVEDEQGRVCARLGVVKGAARSFRF